MKARSISPHLLSMKVYLVIALPNHHAPVDPQGKSPEEKPDHPTCLFVERGGMSAGLNLRTGGTGGGEILLSKDYSPG